MNNKLISWINDSIAADMQHTYRRQINIPFGYEFIGRYADFYVNLLSRALNILNGECEKMNVEQRQAELLSIAHGLEIFNNEQSCFNFDGVNKDFNVLYVAVLYYLCHYEAVATFFLKDCQSSKLNTDSACMIYSIIKGELKENSIFNDHGLKRWLIEGDAGEIESYWNLIHQKNIDFLYVNIDDFFDTQLLEHVLNKFMEDNIRKDLLHFDNTTDWNLYIKYSVNKHIYTFLPSQREALYKGLLTFQRAFSLKMPTSSGKSYLTELVIYQEINQNTSAKVLYLAPLRSLGRELKEKYSRISHQLNFTFRCLYGGSNRSMTESVLPEADLFITTPETFISLEGAIDDLLEQFTLVICDEGQLIESPQRGLNYEFLLSRLKKNKSIRFLFISAIIPNIGDINSWLGGSQGDVGESQYRPCAIRYGVAQVATRLINLKVYDNPDTKNLFTYSPFVNSEECVGVNLSTKKNIGCLMALKSLDAGSVMLYSTFKTGNAGCVKYGEEVAEILTQRHLSTPRSFVTNIKDKQSLESILEYVVYNFGQDFYESRFLANGFAVHTANLPQDIREIVEKGFADGVIRLIICNSTLAEGVNFPIKTLVLGDIRHPSGKNLMDKEILMNVIGRVGRAGIETYGMVICCDKNWWYVKQAAKGENLPLAKGILNEIICEIIVKETKTGIEITDDEINQAIEKWNLNNSLDNNLDEMIMLSSDGSLMDDTSSDSLATASLTYHLGDDKQKREVKRIFSARFKYLSNMDNNEYAIYKETHLNKQKIDELQKVVKSDYNLPGIDIVGLVSHEWLANITNLVFAILDSTYKKDKVLNVLQFWLEGKLYVDMSKSLKMDIEDVISLILWLQRDFLQMSKSIIKYISILYNFKNEELDNWPILVEKGIDSLSEILMLKKGLSDRTVLHCIGHWLLDRDYPTEDKDILYNYLVTNKIEIFTCLNNEKLPKLSQERATSFLDGK